VQHSHIAATVLLGNNHRAADFGLYFGRDGCKLLFYDPAVAQAVQIGFPEIQIIICGLLYILLGSGTPGKDENK
jgi:hypothetical protein